jgi:hypothetical protein
MTKRRPDISDGKKSVNKPSFFAMPRGARGRFLAGNPGGPGRPKGSRNKVTELVEAMLDGEAQALTGKLIALAKRGNATALQIAFARLSPPRRDRLVTLKLPTIQASADLLAAHNAILAAIGDGELTPSEAASITSTLETYRRATETARFEDRLAALEARLASQRPKT